MDEKNKEQIIETTAGRGFKDNDPIGMPDAVDKENIMVIIRKYEKLYPGEIAYLAKDNAKLREGFLDNKFGKGLDKNSGMRFVMRIPAPILRKIERAYPLMLENDKHWQWFVKNFPMFKVPEKH